MRDAVRRICEPFPEVTEAVDGFGHTSFRVKDKPFVMMGEGAAAGPGMSIKTDPFTQEELIAEGRFTRTPYIGQHGWVSIHEIEEGDWPEIEELIGDGYRRVAPARLVRRLDDQ